MPIFEYRCLRCGQVSSHVVLNRHKRDRIVCPGCGGGRLKRLMSAFSVVESEASRLASFDTRAPRGESFYRDSRNVGLWAKKRAKEMGVDLGSQFEATVEKARTGKLLKETE